MVFFCGRDPIKEINPPIPGTSCFPLLEINLEKKITSTCYKGILGMNGPCLNPLCSCSLDIEDTTHYLLRCQHFSNHRYDLRNSVKSIITDFESLTDNNRIDILLYCDLQFDENKHKVILEATINYSKNSERFLGHFLNKIFITW